MIGALNASSVSVVSAQQMQAQRDAQIARAKAERLVAQSQQASEEARQATQRSEGLNKQARAFNTEADRAQKVADSQPATTKVAAPQASDNTAPSQQDDPLPASTLTTAQQLGRGILNQVSGSLASPATAARAYQQVQANTGTSAGAAGPSNSSASVATSGSTAGTASGSSSGSGSQSSNVSSLRVAA